MDLNLFFGIVGILGVIFGVFQWRNPRVLRRINWNHMSTTTLAAPAKGSGIILDGHKIERELSLALVEIRHAGNDRINASDLRDPLRITVTDADSKPIAAFQHSLASNANDTIRIAIDSKSIQITWDYFDPKESICVSIYVDGGCKEISCSGYIGGGYSILKKKPIARSIAIARLIVYPLLFTIIISPTYLYLEFPHMWDSAVTAFNDNNLRNLIRSALYGITWPIILFASYLVLKRMISAAKATEKKIAK